MGRSEVSKNVVKWSEV